MNNANAKHYKSANARPYWMMVNLELKWGTDAPQPAPKYPPGNGFKKLTRLCIYRLIQRGERPADDSLAKWAGVEVRDGDVP
jgi:hypothetical protein